MKICPRFTGCLPSRLERSAQLAIASAAFALLAACGDGDDNAAPAAPPAGVQKQIVSFGDSLS
ncbi:SGNH/GDSL hydrolase family protein, partial [Burkholderia gladioli]